MYQPPTRPSSRGREWLSKTTQKGSDRVKMRTGTQLLDHRGNHISVKVASHLAERLSLAGGGGWVMVPTRGGVLTGPGLFTAPFQEAAGSLGRARESGALPADSAACRPRLLAFP